MVQGTRPDKLTALLKVRDHEILSGISETIGGHDEGFDPHELLQAALTACTIITVQMYADRKKWELVSTDVKVESTTSAEQTLFTREISFRGNLDEDQKARLLDIANHCPIHKLLSGPIKIETKLQGSLT